MKNVYIYCLKDPSGEIKYIGKTINLERRLSAHISEAKSSKTNRYVLNWIKKLLSLNQKPTIHLLEIVNESNWQEKEKYWILYYRNIKSNICNNCDGGLGGVGRNNFTEEELKNKRIIMSKTFSKFNDETKHEIWNMILNNYSFEDILKIYPDYTRHIHYGVKTGRQWADITNLNITYISNKRIGYTCRNGLYMVRKIIDRKQKVVYSSRNEQDVLEYIKNH